MAGLGLRAVARALLTLAIVATVLGAAAQAGTAAPGVKPLITGVVDRNGPPPPSRDHVVDAYVLQVTWSQLQPSRAALRHRVLDRALRVAKRTGARVKLRVLAGVHAPGWAKHLGGPPVRMRDPHDGSRGTVPRFWTRGFGTAYADLQRRLAHRYDRNRRLAEVVISRCTTFYAEPFIRQTADLASRRALRRAGYTAARDRTCHRRQVTAHRVWRRTRSGLALNPAQLVTAGGGGTVDTGFTIAMMRHCRQSLGHRCVLENNSIRSPIASLGDEYRRMYAAMARISPALAFQTATAERMGSCPKTLAWAEDRGASYVEIPWNADEAGCTTQVLADFARRVG